MKFKILALTLCACLLIFTLAGCGIKLSPDTEASPSASGDSPSGSGEATGDSSDVTSVIGIVDSIAAGSVTLKVTQPYETDASQATSTVPGLVGSGSYLYVLQGETQTFTLNTGTIVILEDMGYSKGNISDIMPGDFLAAVLRGDAAVAVVDNGQANVITGGTGQSESTSSPSPDGDGNTDAVPPSPSGSLSPSPGDTTSSGGTSYTVTTDNLKARSGPGTTYDIVGQLSIGTTLTGTVSDGWLKFTYNGKTAYCNVDYLKQTSGGASTSSSAPSPSTGPSDGQEHTYKVAEADLKIRSGPGTTYDILGKLALGEKLTGIVTNGWLKFTYNGATAYCKAEYLTLDS
jgi:uncharacterized protein YgiM (DUF1202 family)